MTYVPLGQAIARENEKAVVNSAPLPEQAPPAKDMETRLVELAKMTPLDYERIRDAEAKALGVRVSVLDREVEARRPKSEDETAEPFEDVEPWPEAVDGAVLLAELQQTVERFCVLPEHSAPLMSAWVLHAWTHDAADISPVLAFVSPEKRCGKTTALSVIGALTPKSMHAVNISTSVLFRVVERYAPTVLIDEADTFLAANDELRGILNGGHNRLSAYVWRSVGDDHEPRRFRVWSPKVIAMIGKLPDTLEDRALVVPLRRRQAGEMVERFRADRLNDFLHLRRKAARWAQDNIIRLREMDPDIPAALNDRAQDNARAICAIADAAGKAWPESVRTALIGLSEQVDDEPQSAGVLLLRDIAEVFESRMTSSIGSTALCEALCALEDSPWAEWRRGLSITPRGVARLLKPFGVRPRRDRAHNVYALADFTDAFRRYLSDTPKISSTSSTSSTSLTSSTEKSNETNAVELGGACGTYSDPAGANLHETASSTPWEGEV